MILGWLASSTGDIFAYGLCWCMATSLLVFFLDLIPLCFADYGSQHAASLSGAWFLLSDKSLLEKPV